MIRPPGACFALCLALLPAAAAAQGQWSGSLVGASEERFRGRAYSGDRPSLRASLGWDHDSGAYVGTSVANAEFEAGKQRAAFTGYAGAGGALDTSLRWDTGLTYTGVAGDSRYDYGEAYAGLGGARWTLRAFWGPSYYGYGVATVYFEAGAYWPLTPDWQLQAHAGALRRTDGRRGTRVDGRLALAWDAAELRWALAWVGVGRDGPFAAPASERRQRWIASVTHEF